MSAESMIKSVSVLVISACSAALIIMVAIFVPEAILKDIIIFVLLMGAVWIAAAVVIITAVVVPAEVVQRTKWRHHTRDFKIIGINKLESDIKKGSIHPKVYLNIATGWANRKTRADWVAAFEGVAVREFNTPAWARVRPRVIVLPYTLTELEEKMESVVALVNRANVACFIDKPKTEQALRDRMKRVETIIVEAFGSEERSETDAQS